MKKLSLFILSILTIYLLSSVTACSSGSSGATSANSILNARNFTVTFHYNNGKDPLVVEVEPGKRVSMPSINPQKNNYIFTGWYITADCINQYDFSSIVKTDFSLYAGFELDASKITNEISQTHMKSVVKVYNKMNNTLTQLTAQGSGVCFKRTGTTYYILTNWHVANNSSNYTNQSFIVEDYKGTQYTAYLHKKNNVKALSAEYDLACLYFTSSSSQVLPLSISGDPVVGDDIISLGAPNGQTNYITYGKVRGYENCNIIEGTKVTFDAITHTAKADHGSSGGPILNSNLQICGINFGGAETPYGQFLYTFAIPANKVKEFLNKYVLT